MLFPREFAFVFASAASDLLQPKTQAIDKVSAIKLLNHAFRFIGVLSAVGHGVPKIACYVSHPHFLVNIFACDYIGCDKI